MVNNDQEPAADVVFIYRRSHSLISQMSHLTLVVSLVTLVTDGFSLYSSK